MIEPIVAPSILSGDFAKLAEECQRMINYGADWLHVDVMDGHFVPNLTIGPPVVSSIRKHTSAFLDCHLMVSNPEQWIKDFAKAGASSCTFHIEATADPSQLATSIKHLGMKCGVSLKPKTEVSEEILTLIKSGLCDMVLIMTVEPGFGGQKFMPECVQKIKQLREMFPDLNIEVDGGINEENIQTVSKAGALKRSIIVPTQPHFPCVEKNLRRFENFNADSGPEPVYSNLHTGFKLFTHPKKFTLLNGGTLPSFQIAYETWGTLNTNKSNCILLCTGLSASSHAKSHPENTSKGWWESFIGPGLALDTEKFHIICTNVLGSCFGTTGPSSINPETNTPYATNFPSISIVDIVRAQKILLDSFGIYDKLYAVVGSSMGGMQSLAFASMFKVQKLVCISACGKTSASGIAMRFVQRSIIMNDPNWKNGFYYSENNPPHVGMKLARMMATIGYRSGPEWQVRFGRKKSSSASGKDSYLPILCADYHIENYLDHQGEKFCLAYDANSYLYLTKAMDTFDLSVSSKELESCKSIDYLDNPKPFEDYNDPTLTLENGLDRITADSLVIGVQTDVLFPVEQQKEIATCLRNRGKRVSYYELDSLYGHDTFLIDYDNVGRAIKGHLE